MSRRSRRYRGAGCIIDPAGRQRSACGLTRLGRRSSRRAPHRLAAGLALAAVCAGGSLVPAAAQTTGRAAPVAERIRKVTESERWRRSHWGIHVRDARTGEALLDMDGDRLFVPASNLKLVVAAAAAHLLGPEFRYSTSFSATGPVVDGVLEGDLVVQGSGDPNLSGRFDRPMLADMKAFADSLASRGIVRIAGGIVADASSWKDEPLNPDWQFYDMYWWYAAPTGPLGFNDNAIDFTIRPGQRGGPARVTWLPEEAPLVFVNRTRTVAPGAEATWDFARVAGTDTIFAYGDVPADARVQTEHFAVRDPAAFFGAILRSVLEARGIEVAGEQVQVVRDPLASALGERELLFTYASRPLSDVIGPILQRSQNWFAEQLVKTLGREVAADASWEGGLEVEERYLLDEVGLDSASFELRDASGLSAGNLIAPSALTELLMHLYGTPPGDMVWEALPVSGAPEGSLRARFLDMPGRIRAKTGSIRNVDSLSGYATTEAGRVLAFSVIVNGAPSNSAEAREAIDKVVRILATL